MALFFLENETIMATVAQENIGTHHEKVIITLSKDDYVPAFNSSLKKQAKQANLPGFRKGMVPAGMLKKMYGAGIFQEEILRMAGAELEKYLMTEKIEFLARPLPAESQAALKLDMNSTGDYVFEYEFAAVPDMKLTLLDKKEKWSMHQVTVTDEMINEEVERFRYKAGNMQDVEEVSVEDNVLNVSITQKNNDAESTAEPKENSLLLKYFTDKAQKELKGKKVGASISMKIKELVNEDVLPAIMKDMDLDPAIEENKEVECTFEVTKIGLVEKPELNEEFFKQIYPNQEIKTEEEFRSQVKSDIENYWSGQSKNFLHNEIYERFIHETEFELPNDFLKRWLLVSEDKYQTAEEVEEAYDSFSHGIRWELILKKLVEENDIDVSKEEIETAVKAQLQQYFGGQPFDESADWVQQFINKQMQDRDTYEKTYRQVLNNKVFDFLENKIDKEEKEIAVDDFIKLPHKHQH
jgi:trigger factor